MLRFMNLPKFKYNLDKEDEKNIEAIINWLKNYNPLFKQNLLPFYEYVKKKKNNELPIFSNIPKDMKDKIILSTAYPQPDVQYERVQEAPHSRPHSDNPQEGPPTNQVPGLLMEISPEENIQNLLPGESIEKENFMIGQQLEDEAIPPNETKEMEIEEKKTEENKKEVIKEMEIEPPPNHPEKTQLIKKREQKKLYITDDYLLCKVFPHLFPYGRGGYKDYWLKVLNHKDLNFYKGLMLNINPSFRKSMKFLFFLYDIKVKENLFTYAQKIHISSEFGRSRPLNFNDLNQDV